MLPPALQALIDQIDACEAEAARLIADLDDNGVNWVPPPAPGVSRWSVAQCLNHLMLMNPFYLQQWPAAVSEAAAEQRGPFTGLRPTPIGRWFVNSFEPPPRFKTKANAVATPGPRFPRDGLLEKYTASHELYRHLVRSSAAVDVNRVIRRNPFLPMIRMRLSTVLMIIPAHDRRHLWQAATVKRALVGA